MRARVPQTIDMTPAGEFVDAPGSPWALKLGVGAAIVAAVTGVIAVGALLLWVAMLLLPVAILAGVVAYVAFRFQGRRG